jgi:hypothetical protein
MISIYGYNKGEYVNYFFSFIPMDYFEDEVSWWIVPGTLGEWM